MSLKAKVKVKEREKGKEKGAREVTPKALAKVKAVASTMCLMGLSFKDIATNAASGDIVSGIAPPLQQTP